MIHKSNSSERPPGLVVWSTYRKMGLSQMHYKMRERQLSHSCLSRDRHSKQKSLCWRQYQERQKSGPQNSLFSFVFCFVTPPLNSFRREQILPETSAFLPVFQLFHVECECQQEKLRLYTPFSPDQKPSEIVVLLQYPEHAFYLYGSVLPKKNTFIGQNIRKRFLSVFHKLWRNPDLSKSEMLYYK